MFYIYRSFSIAGWIAAVVFFVFLAGVFSIRRLTDKKRVGFDVMPVEPPAKSETGDEKQSRSIPPS